MLSAWTHFTASCNPRKLLGIYGNITITVRSYVHHETSSKKVTVAKAYPKYNNIQWRTHRGVSEVKPVPPIEDFKRNDNFFFWNESPFFIQRLPKMLSCFLKNFHCDAIIGPPVVKLFWCAALDVDDCRKREAFLFWNEPTFLREELA